MNKQKINLYFLIAVLIPAGVWYVFSAWRNGVSEYARQVSIIAETAGATFLTNTINKLEANLSDLDKKEYQDTKSRLTRMASVDQRVRFVYLLAQKDNKIFILVDSEPSDSPDYSPPGQEYTEANSQIFQPFKDGQTLITKPTVDRWGTWVSILVPIKDVATGEVVAVLGFDYPANHWNDEAISKTTSAGVIVAILFFLLIIFFIMIRNNFKLKENEEKFRSFVEFTKDAVVIMNEKGVVILWNKAAELMFGYTQAEMLNKEFHQYITVKKEHKNTENILKFGRTGDSKTLGKIMELAVKNKAGEEFMVELAVSKTMVNSKWHAIGVMRDITKRKKTENILKEAQEKTTKALQDADRLNKFMIGRELKMLELKNKIKELENENKK